jgi:hypothetical protein
MSRKCKKCAAGEVHEFKHGNSGYGYHRCRCDICHQGMLDASRSYRERNPEKDAATHSAYYEKNRPHIAARTREYEEQHREQISERRALERLEDPEKFLERGRQWREWSSAAARDTECRHPVDRPVAAGWAAPWCSRRRTPGPSGPGRSGGRPFCCVATIPTAPQSLSSSRTDNYPLSSTARHVQHQREKVSACS